LRVLVASHGHPAIARGGAEIAAFQLFERLNTVPGVEAWFLGCQSDQNGERLGSRIVQPFSDREYVYLRSDFDWFNFANRDNRFPAEFKELLTELRPDIVHFHHFANFGVEVFHHTRLQLPGSRIVLTLHEFLAICHHYGQMVTKSTNSLCYKASPAACHTCFPEIGATDFFLRRKYIERFFELVDWFVYPSEFLESRFAEWGLPATRGSVIENVVPPALARAPDADIRESAVLRIGFFGQISRLKGINVLLDAAQFLERNRVDDVVFEIFGDHRNQPPEIQNEFLQRLAAAGSNVRFRGPYDPVQVDDLMRIVDVTVVPSIWWENSPVVIQEAFRNRRPIICSNIGGMAEKVRDGIDGWHFRVGDSIALASLIKRLAANRASISEVASKMQNETSADATVRAHIALYTDTELLRAGTQVIRLGK
jgi:glycosyltransferase involved in cell wall biosynthesis